ncbi:MAG: phosphoglucosamine mutase, partial [Candidatus Aenigmatarchaeota archaeon]
AVRESDADLGFAHDGDGDRIATVDEKGRFVRQDDLLALMGSYYSEHFDSGVVTTVDASKIVDEEVGKTGGEVVRTEVGDVNVVRDMEREEFSFGGEPSGTWILGDLHMSPDGIIAAARVLELLDFRGEGLSDLIESIPSYP